MSEIELRFNKRTGALKLDAKDFQGTECIDSLDQLQDVLGVSEVIEETEKEELSYTDVNSELSQGCG